MPLSSPADREPLHRRQIECRGYRRKDGLFDIEGHLVDTKSYGFTNMERGELKPGDPIHEMWLRLTIDESMVIQDIEAVTDASPFRVCPDITPSFAKLKGIKIGPGMRRAIQERVGGARGCTHLVELMGPLATTAYQTLVILRRKRDEGQPAKKPWIIDTCHAWSSEGDVVKKRWPAFYTGADKTGAAE
jgi:hypothetical protein